MSEYLPHERKLAEAIAEALTAVHGPERARLHVGDGAKLMSCLLAYDEQQERFFRLLESAVELERILADEKPA